MSFLQNIRRAYNRPSHRFLNRLIVYEFVPMQTALCHSILPWDIKCKIVTHLGGLEKSMNVNEREGKILWREINVLLPQSLKWWKVSLRIWDVSSCLSLLHCLCSPKDQGSVLQNLTSHTCVLFHLLCPYWLCSKYALPSSLYPLITSSLISS